MYMAFYIKDNSGGPQDYRGENGTWGYKASAQKFDSLMVAENELEKFSRMSLEVTGARVVEE